MKSKILLFLAISASSATLHAQSGNVGIGTTTPASKLTVSGNASVGSGYAGTAAPANGAIIEGNVGIGVTVPTGKLAVSGNGGGTTPILKLTNSNVAGNPTLNIYPGYTSSTVAIAEGNANAVVFDQDPGQGSTGAGQSLYDFHGRLRAVDLDIFQSARIGTIPAGSISDGIMTADGSGNVRQLTLAALAAGINANYSWSLTGNAGAPPSAGNFIGTLDANDFAMRTNNTEKMRITSSGYLCIGTAAPLFSFENSQVSVVTGSGEGLHVRSSSSDLNGLLTLEKVAATTNIDQFVFFRANGANVGQIIADGTGGVLYQTLSDMRLKENIRSTHYGIADVMKIQVRDYNFKTNKNSQQTGFIAQQLYTVFPGAVTKGGADISKPWMVDYSKMTPLLTKAIQDQQTEIDALRAEVEALKNANAGLKAEVSKVEQLSDELNVLKASIEKLVPASKQELVSVK